MKRADENLEKTGVTRENWIDCLKFVACLLITNSHCKEIYPVSFFAIGGGFGNAIFFALQGYLLVNIHSNFFRWYWSRLKRLLPAICVISLLDLLVNNDQAFYGATSILGFCELILNKYWFCKALLIYYVVYYVFIGFKIRDNINKLRRIKVASVLWLGGYMIYYLALVKNNVFFVELGGFSAFKVYFYFGVMLAGAYIRLQREKICHYLSLISNMRMAIFCGIGFGAVWAAEYACIMIWNQLLPMQMLIHVGVFGFTVILITVCMSSSSRFLKAAFISLIANATLEIYLFQVCFEQIKHIGTFPINLFVFWGFAISGGILIHELITFIQKMIGFVGEKSN